jgi:hypothetical protein
MVEDMMPTNYLYVGFKKPLNGCRLWFCGDGKKQEYWYQTDTELTRVSYYDKNKKKWIPLNIERKEDDKGITVTLSPNYADF